MSIITFILFGVITFTSGTILVCQGYQRAGSIVMLISPFGLIITFITCYLNKCDVSTLFDMYKEVLNIK